MLLRKRIPVADVRSSLIDASSRICAAAQRTAPCTFAIASSVNASVRSRILPRMASPARISCFSASVSVSTRRVSISSISVPSKKSPALSGRNCGIVIQDDRRAEHHPALRLLTHQHRKHTHVAARRSRIAKLRPGSSNETNSPPSIPNNTCADTNDLGSASSRFAAARRKRTHVLKLHVQCAGSVGSWLCSNRQRRLQRLSIGALKSNRPRYRRPEQILHPKIPVHRGPLDRLLPGQRRIGQAGSSAPAANSAFASVAESSP